MRFWGVQRFHFLQLMNNRFLQPPEDGLLRGDCQYRMILWNWPKKTWMSYYVLNRWRVAAIAVDLPHSYFLALHQNVLKASYFRNYPSYLLPIEINVHVIWFFLEILFALNPLSPKSDQQYQCFIKQSGLKNWVHESGQMSLTDISTNSPHYFYWKSIGTVNGNVTRQR